MTKTSIYRPDWGVPAESNYDDGGGLTYSDEPTLLEAADQTAEAVTERLLDLDVPAATIDRWFESERGIDVSLRNVRAALKPLLALDPDEVPDMLARLSTDAQDWALSELEKGLPVIRPTSVNRDDLINTYRSTEEGADLWARWGGGRMAEARFVALERRFNKLLEHPEIVDLVNTLSPAAFVALAVGLVGV